MVLSRERPVMTIRKFGRVPAWRVGSLQLRSAHLPISSSPDESARKLFSRQNHQRCYVSPCALFSGPTASKDSCEEHITQASRIALLSVSVTVLLVKRHRPENHAAPTLCRRPGSLAIENGFGWLKQTGSPSQVKLRGPEKVDWLFVFRCAAQNLIRLPKLLAQPPGRLMEQCA